MRDGGCSDGARYNYGPSCRMDKWMVVSALHCKLLRTSTQMMLRFTPEWTEDVKLSFSVVR
jgi:hypothetical protein